MTHTHTVGNRRGPGMVTEAARWESLGLLNNLSDSTRCNGAPASSCTTAASSPENRSTLSGRRIPTPSFLRMNLEDLHRGAFTEMNAKIDALPKDSSLVGLYERLLAGVETVHGVTLVGEVMGLLWASRRGLSVSELSQIVGRSEADVDDLCRALTSHLIKRNGLLTFAHNGLRTAIEARYITVENRLEIHSRIARFFRAADKTARRLEELPWQFAVSGSWDELKNTIAELSTATAMIACDEQRADLARYWKALEGHYDVTVEYIASLDRADDAEPEAHVEESIRTIAGFLVEIGRTDDVEALHSRTTHQDRRQSPLHREPVLLNRRVRGNMTVSTQPQPPTQATG